MKKEWKNLKIEEIKFVSTNTFFNDKYNEYLLIKDKRNKTKPIGYESNCDK
jgi:hypothetical protein